MTNTTVVVAIVSFRIGILSCGRNRGRNRDRNRAGEELREQRCGTPQKYWVGNLFVFVSPQRTLLEVPSTVVAHDDQRSTKGWCSFLAAATLLLVCVARSRGVVPTVHFSHLLRGNTGSSEMMSAVHYVPEAGTKGGSCLKFWGTACGSDLSCDDNHVCQDNAGFGQPYGDDANGIDCISPFWCCTYDTNADDFNHEYLLCDHFNHYPEHACYLIT